MYNKIFLLFIIYIFNLNYGVELQYLFFGIKFQNNRIIKNNKYLYYIILFSFFDIIKRVYIKSLIKIIKIFLKKYFLLLKKILM